MKPIYKILASLVTWIGIQLILMMALQKEGECVAYYTDITYLSFVMWMFSILYYFYNLTE